MRESLRDRRNMAATVICGALGGICAAAQAWLLALLVATAFPGGIVLGDLQRPLVLLLAIIVLRGGLNWLEERCALSLGGSVQQNLRRRLLEKIDALGPVKIREQQYGEHLTMLTEGLDTLEVYFQKYLPQLFKCAILPVAFLIIIFPLDWPTGLIMVITAPLVPLFMSLIGQWTKHHTLRQWNALSQMGGYFQDIFEGLSTLKLFNRTAGQREKTADLSEGFRVTNLQVLKWGFLSALALEMLTTISIAMISVGLGLRLVYGGIDFRGALFLLFIAPEFYLPLRSLGTQYHNSLNGAAAAKSMFALLERKDDHTDGNANFCGDAGITFDNVSFVYEAGRPALDGVSFTLQAGEKLGLVGVSGSGKTTLLHLLAGFICPDSGSIRLGGQSLSSLSPQTLRNQIAFVSQDPYLFRGSLMDNIRLGSSDAGNAEIISLCRELGAHELFAALPQGYDTPVGQGGRALSGGERQLLAIARACLKDAPVILLDEATRNVDWQHNYSLQQALARVCRGKTVIVIAHRLQTLAGMDKLLVLEQGRIAQFGAFHELRAQPGALSRLLGQSAADWTATAAEDGTAAAVPAEPVPLLQTEPPAEPAAMAATPSSGSLMSRMLLLCRPYAALITGSSLLSASSIAANIALLGFSAYLISRASLSPPLWDLMTVIVAVRFFGISRAVLRYAERYISHDVTFRILTKLRLWYYDQMEKLSFVSLQKLGLGRVFKHIIGDVDILKFFYLRVLTVPVQALLILAAVSIFQGYYNWKLVLVIAAFFLLGGIICPYLLRRFLVKRRTDYNATRQVYSETLYDYINGLADQQIYGGTRHRLDTIENHGHKIKKERYYIGLWDSFASAISSLLANLALFAALLVMIPLVAAHQVSPLVLASVIWVMWASFEALQPVATMSEYLNLSRGALSGMEEAAARPREPERTGTRTLPAAGGLAVENLSFAYEEGQPLLRDLSFALQAGSKTALLGSSGAGKTTLLNLITGFLPYEKGRIHSGGIELKESDNTHLRRHIGYLEQRPYLFHASIRENILLAKEDAGEQEMLAAAAHARLDGFIATLPDGYDTLVGENGYKLSAGQRQRLALARLFLQDAPVIVLDEATQSLDTENRDSLFAALKDWWADKTVLYVTHDSHGLADMDNILIMEQGCLVEQGNEAQLLKAGGRYAKMHAIEHSFF
ncbi:MAG: thiol reductant ABC exporter subunit CydD [Treponema sp.]|nr:thiol reductant ABC exporter subunit CydD [Treponema sp.]